MSWSCWCFSCWRDEPHESIIIDKEIFVSINTAIKSGNLLRLSELIQSNPDDLYFTCPLGNWLHVASAYEQLESLKLLVGLGLDINEQGGLANSTPINISSAKGHVAIVKWLLKNGATLDVSEPERNPLFSAIIGNHIEVGILLIRHGIDTKVEYPGDSMKGMDALALAKERGAIDFVKLLRS